MECRETQTLLTAFHDGELPAADRAPVEEHLRGCPECAALLADLARVDRAAGVPDPGPAYWDRFNARVMDRVEREADGSKVTVLRPKGGWMREQLRYLVPAAVAAGLVVMLVRYGGIDSGVSTTARDGLVPGQAEMPRGLSPRPPAAPPAVRKPAAPDSAGERMAKAEHESDGQGGPGAGAGRDATGSVAPAVGSPPVTETDGMIQGSQAERKKMQRAAVPMAEPRGAGKAASASGTRVAKDPSPGSPCELARALAERERFREAETAQRACLAQDPSAPAQEKGLVFLAELLDRQARFAEADAVIADVDRLFPQSRPLDLYLQQRPMVQRQPMAVPITR